MSMDVIPIPPCAVLACINMLGAHLIIFQAFFAIAVITLSNFVMSFFENVAIGKRYVSLGIMAIFKTFTRCFAVAWDLQSASPNSLISAVTRSRSGFQLSVSVS